MTFSQPLSLSGLATRRYVGTLMFWLTIVVLGVFIIVQLPVDLLPSITYPRVGLRLNAPGVTPAVGVDEITRPLEEALSATEGVVQVFSQTREGQVSLDLFFQPGENVDQALNDATAAFNRSRNQLPDIIEEPRIFKVDPSQLPVYEFALTSPVLTAMELRIFADEDLSRELTRVNGVASVDVSGGVDEEVQVNLDLQRLQSLGLEIPDVLDALSDRNQDVSGGLIRGGEREVETRLLGKFQTVEEIKDLAIEVTGTTPPRQVYVRDFATVTDGTQEQRIFVTLNGQNAVKVSVRKQQDANTIVVVDGVKAKLEDLRNQGLITPEMTFTATLDESKFIRNSIQNVIGAGLSGAGLAAIAVLLFLGSVRKMLIIILTIPLATLTALLLMGLCGLSLNVFSLGGLALGIGNVLDNSIVMLENITSLKFPRSSGRSPVMAAVITKSEELESALLAGTAANVVSVLPFLFIGGLFALLFNELILTITFAAVASPIVAVTIVPVLSYRFLDFSKTKAEIWPPLRFCQHLVEALIRGYSHLLRWVLHRRGVVILLTLLIFGGGSVWMIPQIPQEVLPSINTGQANLRVQFPPSTTLDQNRQVMGAIDEILLAQPETLYAFTTAGGALFGTNTNANTLRGSSTITLKSGTDVQAFSDRLTETFDQLNLIDTTIRINPEVVRGLILTNSPVRSDLDLGLQGDDPDLLQQAGQKVLKALRKEAKLARYRPEAEEIRPEVQIQPDWERVADLGLTAPDLGQSLQTALTGTVPTQLQRGDRLVDIRVQLPPETIQNLGELRQIPLFSGNSLRQPILLGNLATIQNGTAPGEIQRLNQRSVFLISGSLGENVSLSQALTELDRVLETVELPPGITRLPSAAAATNQEVQNALKLLGILATFFVFGVMAIQYNSLTDPLVIILTVPFALVGGIVGLFVTETAIGATVILGAILLVGIVVNNAIIMVELANQIRAEGTIEGQTMSRIIAIQKAAPQRLRPILMTTLTTVLGLFPLALGQGEGGEFLQPLGVVVFSGLSIATVLTLFLIPCFYSFLDGWNDGKKEIPKPIFTLP